MNNGSSSPIRREINFQEPSDSSQQGTVFSRNTSSSEGLNFDPKKQVIPSFILPSLSPSPKNTSPSRKTQLKPLKDVQAIGGSPLHDPSRPGSTLPTVSIGKNRRSLNNTPSLTSIESSVQGDGFRDKTDKGKGRKGSFRSRFSELSSVSSTEVAPENFVPKLRAPASHPSTCCSIMRFLVFLGVFFAGTLLAVVIGSPISVGPSGVLRVNKDPFNLVPWRSTVIDASLNLSETVYTLDQMLSASAETLGKVRWVAFYTNVEQRIAHVAEVRKSLVSGKLLVVLASGDILHVRGGQDFSILERPNRALLVWTSDTPTNGAVESTPSCFSCPANSHVPRNESWRSDNASACVCDAGYSPYSPSLPFRCEPDASTRRLSSSALCLGSDSSGNLGPISDNTPCELPFVFNDESTATAINFTACATLEQARPNGVGPYNLEVEDIGYVASWCPPQGLTTYERMGVGEVKNYNWGLCVACPTSEPTISPTLAPTQSPSATPSKAPTARQPSAAPSTTPTLSPVLNFTRNGTTSLVLNVSNTTKIGGNDTNSSSSFTNRTNITMAPVSTGSPSSTPTIEPTLTEDGTHPIRAASIQLVLEADSKTSYLDMWSGLTGPLQDMLRNLTNEDVEVEATINAQERLSFSFEGNISNDAVGSLLSRERCGSRSFCSARLIESSHRRRVLSSHLLVYLFEVNVSGTFDDIPQLNLTALAGAITSESNATSTVSNATLENHETLVTAELRVFAAVDLNSSSLLNLRHQLNSSEVLETATSSIEFLNITIVAVGLCQEQTCNGNGVCANGRCVCDQGFSGTDCDSVVVGTESPTTADCGPDEFTNTCLGSLLHEEAEWYCSNVFSGQSLCHFEDLKTKLELDYKKAHSTDLQLNSQEFPELVCATSQGDVWTKNLCLNGEGNIVLSCSSGTCASTCERSTTLGRHAAICCAASTVPNEPTDVRFALSIPSTQPTS